VRFQQDDSTAHTSRRSFGILREIFPGHVAFLRGDICWPPRSTDLTPCDFFLWGYLKTLIQQHRPQTLEGLKEAITQEDAAIPPEMTHRVMEKYRERLNHCIDNEGRNLSDVHVVFSFKTTLCKLFKIYRRSFYHAWFGFY
jgi:hypothetical protein